MALDCVSALEVPPCLWGFCDWPRLAADCSSLRLWVRERRYNNNTINADEGSLNKTPVQHLSQTLGLLSPCIIWKGLVVCFFSQEKHWHPVMEGSLWSPCSKWHELSRCSDPTNRSHHHEPALQQTNQTGWHCLDASAATNQLHQSVLVRKQIMAPKTTIRNKTKLIPITDHQTLLKLTLMSLVNSLVG